MSATPAFPTNAEWSDHIAALPKRTSVICTLTGCACCAWGEAVRAKRVVKRRRSRPRVVTRAYDPEFDRRVNETWRIMETLRLEIGQDALDALLAEWAEGRTAEEHARLVRTRVFLGHGSVYPWYPAFSTRGTGT